MEPVRVLQILFEQQRVVSRALVDIDFCQFGRVPSVAHLATDCWTSHSATVLLKDSIVHAVLVAIAVDGWRRAQSAS